MLDNKRAVLKLLTALTLLSAVKEISGQVGCRDTQTWCAGVSHLCESLAVVKTSCKVTCKACATNSETCVAKKCSQVCNENESRTVATCSCFKGYALDGNGRTCTDIDECATNPCTKSFQTCQNFPGAYACTGCSPSDGEFFYYEREECCKLNSVPQCGQSANNNGRVVGGVKATPGNWPWMAYIVIKNNLCGGSLISNEWIVTAAHCFAAINPQQDLGTISVVLGIRNTTSSRNVHEQTFGVTQLIIHPDNTGFESDIALIRLNKPARYGDFVKPVCLPNGETPPEGEKCYATGYGTTSYRGAVAKQLQEVDLPVVNTDLCNSSLAGSISVNPQTMMCAGYAEGGKDACQGDSGGPLVCQRCDSCDWYLAGVTSFGKGCANAGVYGVWTKVEKFEQWISDQTAVPVSKSSKCPKAGASWSSWSTWTKCTKTCATGNSQRQRTCSGGAVGSEGCIGATSQSKKCNEQACPTWGQWGEWSRCSKTCERGSRTAKRNCQNGPGCVGESEKTSVCNSKACPKWTPWSDWTTCSKTCGNGSRTSSRTCSNGNIGQEGCIGEAESNEACNTEACPTWTQWTDWTTCSKTCGVGSRTSTRTCSNGNIGQEGCIGEAEKSEACNTETCPSWGVWEGWNECSVTCGGGTQSSSRKCKHGTVGQVGCVGSETRYRDCATNACLGEWTKWTNCSKSCGNGTQTRSRDDETETRSCNEAVCPKWSEWSEYSDCSKTCGTGESTRIRACLNSEVGQDGCDGPAENKKDCNTQACPKWTQWSVWTTCSKTCGGGSRTSTRTCSNGNIGQEGCIGEAQRSEACNTKTCPSWSDWDSWNECSVTCGGGTQSSSRKCNHGTVGEAGCEGSATRGRNCATNACLGEWTKWNKCSKSCGNGIQTRSRDDETETRSCNEAVCPSWSKWSEFSDCSKTCGNGESTRTRTCLNGEVGQDGCDGQTENKKDCNTQACPKWTQWTDWTTCSKTCGVGSRTSTRTCSNGNIGQEGCIGEAEKSEACNTETCPSWSDWDSWNECSVTCGGGTQSSSRKCNHGTVGEAGCEGSATRSRKCATNDCTVFSSWTRWSKCTASCGSGKQSRTRTCAQAGLCPADEHGDVVKQTQDCTIAECPKWNAWGPYGSCSASCGGGSKTRTRTCTGGNGACEGDAEDSTKCNTAPCTTCQGLKDGFGTFLCNGYALSGYCKGPYEAIMLQNCAATCCKLNKNPGAAQCINTQPDSVCDSYFSQGLCPLVNSFCRKSCKVC